MPPLPAPRRGDQLTTKGRFTEFSLWPTKRLRAHAKIQPKLFSLHPWGILRNGVVNACPINRREEALASLRQAEDFYLVGTERGVEAARPLALYYCYMNLLKVLCLTRGSNPTFCNAQHGITEIFSTNYEGIILRAFPSPNAGKLQNFSEMLTVVSGSGFARTTDFQLGEILPQILPGHRLWCDATNNIERFISLDSIQFWKDPASRTVWIRIHLYADDLSRLGISHAKFLTDSCLASDFREVAINRIVGGRRIICFEQISPHTYPANHPADVLEGLVRMVRSNLWCTVSTIPPYRRYYAYMSPESELSARLPQLLSIYALIYQLGSVTRYRPQDYDKILAGKFGARILDFVTGQPAQFLFLLASEIAHQEITQPSII